MILVGSQRGGAGDLARHLLKEENEHVELHELRGFASGTLQGALNESYAISRATRCRQHLFSLSLNPPPGENVTTDAFEDAIGRIEEKLGLAGQPRAIVFHEKEGRRHCHAVWSRIDAEELKAVPLPFSKTKLRDIARELFLEHGWKMPRGLARSEERDPRNFTLEQWQQAKRAGKDARQAKIDFQDAWAMSDSRAAFAHALKARGYWLAQGDRRGFVAIDLQGEVYAVARQVGVKTKAVRERLGNEAELPSVAETKAQIGAEMLPVLEGLKREQDARDAEMSSGFERQRTILVERQRAERRAFREVLQQRWDAEARQRQARFRKGLTGLWDRLRGEHRRIRQQNELEAEEALKRDRAEKDSLIFRQLGARRSLQASMKAELEARSESGRELRGDIEVIRAMKLPELAGEQERMRERFRRRQDQRERTRSPKISRDGPEPER